jgi:hypothetical protein
MPDNSFEGVNSSRAYLLPWLVLGAVLSPVPNGWAQHPTDSIHFRRYYNDRWGFCVSYPTGWDMDEGGNHAGIGLFKPPSAPVASIRVGALPDQPRGFLTGNYDDMKPMTLQENIQSHLKPDSSAPFRKVELIESRSTRIAGVEATMTIARLTDRKGVSTEKVIWLLRRGAVYTFENI